MRKHDNPVTSWHTQQARRRDARSQLAKQRGSHMSVRIDPTPGRIVWFFTVVDMGWGDHIAGDDQPRAAIVTRILSPSTVNLCVFDHNGAPHPVTSVRLAQDGETTRRSDPPAVVGDVHWAEWMPYQKGQAAKQEVKPEQRAPAWPPVQSAAGMPDGQQRRGSTGQLFMTKNGNWVRVEEDTQAPTPARPLTDAEFADVQEPQTLAPLSGQPKPKPLAPEALHEAGE